MGGQRLLWLLRETFDPENTRAGTSFLEDRKAAGRDGLVGSIFEVGPRMTFCTAYSSNAVSGGGGRGRSWASQGADVLQLVDGQPSQPLCSVPFVLPPACTSTAWSALAAT